MAPHSSRPGARSDPSSATGTTYRIGQANNALMFPGLGLGVIVCRAATMPPSLFIAAARALAKLADPTDPAKGLLPDISRLREVSATVAVDVVNAAAAAGHRAGRRSTDPIEAVHEAMWDARVPTHRRADRRIRTTRPTQQGSDAWRRPSQRCSSTRWSRPASARCTASSGTRRTRSSTPCVGTSSDIEFIHVRNEEAGAFAAGADAQISGRPTAVLGSSGPGSLHLLNGLYDCQRNGAPVFAIATHIPSTEIGSGYFQETNPEAIFSGCYQLRAPWSRRPRPDAPDLRARPPGRHPRAWCRHDHPAGRHRRR